jgi:hypothetical protein
VQEFAITAAKVENSGIGLNKLCYQFEVGAHS